MNAIEHHVECAVHDGAHVFRIEPLRHRRKPTDVEEKHGGLFAFAPDGDDCTAGAAELLLKSDGLLTEAATRSDSRLWRTCQPSDSGDCWHRASGACVSRSPLSQAACHA